MRFLTPADTTSQPGGNKDQRRRQTTRTPLSRHFINGIHKRTRRNVTAIAALLAKADIGATDCAYTPR